MLMLKLNIHVLFFWFVTKRQSSLFNR